MATLDAMNMRHSFVQNISIFWRYYLFKVTVCEALTSRTIFRFFPFTPQTYLVKWTPYKPVQCRESRCLVIFAWLGCFTQICPTDRLNTKGPSPYVLCLSHTFTMSRNLDELVIREVSARVIF